MVHGLTSGLGVVPLSKKMIIKEKWFDQIWVSGFGFLSQKWKTSANHERSKLASLMIK